MAFTTISRRTSLLILLLAVVIHNNRFSSVTAAKNSSIFLQRWWKQRRLDKSSSRNNDQKKKKKKGDGKMGQVIRIMKYDRAENERNAIEGLKLIGSSSPLHWFRLDDGVMGGQSETNHQYLSSEGVLKFEGTINTNGGGFCSIRGKASSSSSSSSSSSQHEVGVVPTKTLLPPETSAIRICVQGDGKTYKLLLSDGNKSMFGPGKRSPSWQADIPTTVDKETVLEIPLTSFRSTRCRYRPRNRLHVVSQAQRRKSQSCCYLWRRYISVLLANQIHRTRFGKRMMINQSFPASKL